MTSTYLAERKVEDLRLGDMFTSWAVMEDEKYPAPRRITNITYLPTKKEFLRIWLEDGKNYDLGKDMVVIVREVA